MCGGINVSQSLQNRAFESKKIVRADFMPSLLYNAGRVASYTLIGFVLGALGFFLVGGTENAEVSLPFFVQGGLKIIAGVFMIFAGISLLGARDLRSADSETPSQQRRFVKTKRKPQKLMQNQSRKKQIPRPQVPRL